ncbi:MAG: sensor histidine kinase [Actinomycetota bacterium]
MSVAGDPESVILVALAHEIRRHLTPIIGVSALALERGNSLTDEERIECSEMTLRTALKLEQLLRDLTDVQRFDSNGWVLHRRMTDVRLLIDEMVPGFDLKDRQLTVTGDGPPVDVDSELLERIIDNLVQNAKQHTADGTPISIDTSSDSTGSNISVQDAGPGVPDEHKRLIFEPFWSDAVGGSGLGLALVQRFAVAHGGSAWVEDAPGGGACFRVRLPSESDSNHSAETSQRSRLSNPHKLRIVPWK